MVLSTSPLTPSPPTQDRSINKTENFVSVRVTLGRRLLSTFMTIYVPTLLLNIIALTTNYFKVGDQSEHS